MVRIYLTCLLVLTLSCINAQGKNGGDIKIKTEIFTVLYSQSKEQPIKLIYKSSNRVKNVDRGSMNFYTENKYHTSDNHDYRANVWDKGHLAPAATFSDSKENLKQTFTFLNCALQNQYLNRGAWRILEEKERSWDNTQELIITVDVQFSNIVLPTGATLPSSFIKHIKFTKDKTYKCYSFPNERPSKKWSEYRVKHNHSTF